MAGVSERRVCQVLAVPRSAARDREEKGKRRRAAVDEVLAARIQKLIGEFPTYGYRRLWAILRFRDGVVVNRKAVYRVLSRKRWLVHQRQVTPRPRVQASRSRTAASNQRWALDVTHVEWAEDAALRDADRMKLAVKACLPELQELVEDRKLRIEVQVLPHETLQQFRMIGHVIKDLCRRQTVAFEHQVNLTHDLLPQWNA